MVGSPGWPWRLVFFVGPCRVRPAWGGLRGVWFRGQGNRQSGQTGGDETRL
ncbi:hypothetical protein LC55x_3757 [Lysobacter capsici]|nr:hypothetical protein LC55x_3757 [Lysobacter capsici]